MNKFTLGVVAGMSSLTLAVPLVAQLSFAETVTDSEGILVNRRTPTQECLLAMVSLEDAHLAHFDEMQTTMKQEMQSRRDGLSTVANISDDTARAEALKQMHEDKRAEFEAKELEIPADVEAAQAAVKEACGDTFMFFGKGHGPMMKMMHGPGGRHGVLLEKLDMTEKELKAALESGKTIEELAEEKGVELPVRAERFMKARPGFFFDKPISEPIE